MGNIVDTVEGRIQNAMLTEIDNLRTRKIEFLVRSINSSSEQDAASVTANSEREECIRNTASSEIVSERNNTFHALNTNDETLGDIPEEVSELSCRSQEHVSTGNHKLITASFEKTNYYYSPAF